MKNLADMKKAHAPYAREIAKTNAHDLKTMQGSKEGKYILTSVEQMGKAVDGLTKLIKKKAIATAFFMVILFWCKVKLFYHY